MDNTISITPSVPGRFPSQTLEDKRLAGSTEWIELDGTTDCRKILDGRGEVEEMNVESADKSLHIQGLAVRLYNPKSHQVEYLLGRRRRRSYGTKSDGRPVH